MTETIDFTGDENIGVYTRVFEDHAFVPLNAPEEYVSVLEKRLGVEVVKTTIQGSSIIGSLLVGNSNGMITSGLATAEESEILKSYGNVMFLSRTMNAAGNIILANDELAVVHPGTPERVVEKISDFLDVPVLMMTIGGIPTVGMAAVATNTGILVSPGITAQELKELEEIAGELPIGTGTVNMGSSLVGTGLLANSKSFIAGSSTSGYELGRIEDVFGFV
ncbi:translation initiation factor IF-6 [Methanoplanus sp. FWC-SCC4]|uniref:Translation initiation factor 6 n=1 Tax=Methanochimaera problematica TaxID=2609417 RepID=A0AA97I3D0_9EURY|nr:translation initiation factor IF-6 [Methanoplanus sp. FWC-SCC4]WOF15761.1 translation initiation factor IF-6 [Methanoplanus sp. FWC-SCC4]